MRQSFLYRLTSSSTKFRITEEFIRIRIFTGALSVILCDALWFSELWKEFSQPNLVTLKVK